MTMNTKSSLACLSRVGGFGREFMLFSFFGVVFDSSLSQSLPDQRTLASVFSSKLAG